MSIGEFSAMCGLSPKQLRSYAVTGLLVPCAVDADSGYRYYAPAQLPTAELIDALRRPGMPLAEIKSVLGDKDVTRLDQWASHLRADASRKRQALDQACELLAAIEKTRAGKEVWTMRLQAAGRSEPDRSGRRTRTRSRSARTFSRLLTAWAATPPVKSRQHLPRKPLPPPSLASRRTSSRRL
jgi:DNA-binding transcriptional MerR regulator